MSSLVEVSPAVSEALAAHAPVVALESTIISHGLPRPGNLAAADQLDPQVFGQALAGALAAAASSGIRGKAVTPFLLDHIDRVTGGASVTVNLTIARGNIELAGQIARAWAERAAGPLGG